MTKKWFILDLQKELVIIRSWLDEKALQTKAKQRLTNLIKKLEDQFIDIK